MQWRDAVVVTELRRWRGAVEYAVTLDDETEVRALAYPAVTGEPVPGDRVLLNVGALFKGLGTGGLAFVVAIPDRLPEDGEPQPGHIVKARYTPLQQMFLAVDEQESPEHDRFALDAAADLQGMPVVVADLHSSLPAIVAGIRTEVPTARIAYVMTDGGALPLAFSRSVASLSALGQLAATITVGQAYGGDHEAVTLHSGLLAARHVVGADIAVVIQGPGNVGTGTAWGFSGVAAGEALNAVATLGGRGVATLRVATADARERHRGISHHSRTAYGRVCLVGADVPVLEPVDDLSEWILLEAEALVVDAPGALRVRPVPATGLLEALRASPIPLSTMGRGLQDDPAAFLYAAAAGRWAGRLLKPQ